MFETQDDFYRYWRRYHFTIGRAVQAQLDRLLAGRQQPVGSVPPVPGDLQ